MGRKPKTNGLGVRQNQMSWCSMYRAMTTSTSISFFISSLFATSGQIRAYYRTAIEQIATSGHGSEFSRDHRLKSDAKSDFLNPARAARTGPVVRATLS